MGEAKKKPLRLNLDRRLRRQFTGFQKVLDGAEGNGSESVQTAIGRTCLHQVLKWDIPVV